MSALVGCSTISKKNCSHANWEDVGKVDGELNRYTDFWEQHKSACSKKFNLEQWKSGYQQGLNYYCTEPGAYLVGKNGSEFPFHCPQDQHEKLELSYREGKK